MSRSRRYVRLTALLVLVLAGAVGLTVGPATAGNGAGASPVAITDRGLVRGVDHGAYLTYSGVPYAAPPVGALRWQDPQPATAWTGIRDASKPGAACAQPNPVGTTGFVGSEDCLFLNVTAPARTGVRRPVMVWVHGGFGTGQGSDYDPATMATVGNVIVITINYRLGVFSFFGHPELHGLGDFGYADQRAALRWVQRNAVAFGGDPHNVTLFGESSGALSVCSQLASPQARGLFNKVILQSGSCLLQIPKNGIVPGAPLYDQWVPASQTETRGTQLAASFGCTVPGSEVACLRGVPTAQLATPTNTQNLGFTSYGIPSLPTLPADALRQGDVLKVPVLLGTNLDEMRLFVNAALVGGYTIDANTYNSLLTDTFGPAAGQVGATYPLTNYPSPAVAWASVLTDASFSCTGLSADEAFSAHVPTYAYEFADEHAPNPTNAPEAPGFPIGAAHTFEFASLFDIPGVSLTPAQQSLSNQMIDYWTRFARSANPNGPSTPAWPRFTDAGQQVQILAPGPDGAHVSDQLSTEHHCDFWQHLATG